MQLSDQTQQIRQQLANQTEKLTQQILDQTQNLLPDQKYHLQFNGCVDPTGPEFDFIHVPVNIPDEQFLLRSFRSTPTVQNGERRLVSVRYFSREEAAELLRHLKNLPQHNLEGPEITQADSLDTTPAPA